MNYGSFKEVCCKTGMMSKILNGTSKITSHIMHTCCVIYQGIVNLSEKADFFLSMLACWYTRNNVCLCV